uniref:Uncharacterized protein n=1 Tax=Sphaerodactylus townsendi TaxID=933632 RepID=A0ACB8FPD0_9SAUR
MLKVRGSQSQEQQLQNLRMGEDLDATMNDQEALVEEAAMRDEAGGELVQAMEDQGEHQLPGEDLPPPPANAGKVNQRESHVLGKSGNGLPAKRQCLREQMEQSAAGNVQGREIGRGASVRTRKQKQILDL